MAFKQRLGLYYQLAKPGIIYGNLVTAAAGFLLAAKGDIDWSLFIFTLLGVALVIGSACIFNNYTDRGVDSRMTRTKKRALVSGEISPTRALVAATIFGLVGFSILAIHVNLLVTVLAISASFFYVVIYGLVKRHSVHGALVGTIPGAAPPVMGYCAITDHLDGGALILFLILIFWQMPHFYGIALYRFKEYKAAGLPVMPTKAGVLSTKIQAIAYMAGFVAAVISLWALGYIGRLCLVIIGLAWAYWLWVAIKNFSNGDSKIWGKKVFLSSLLVNLVFAASIAFNWLLVKI